MHTRHKSDQTCLDLTQAIGYPVHIHINRLSSKKPLYWVAYSDRKQISKGRFLESPGLPLSILLGDALQQLPNPVFDVVHTATPCRQFAVLQAMLSSLHAQELALSSPMLFLLLVEHSIQNGIHEHYFLKLICKKRKRILQHIGLVDSTSTLKILARTHLHLRYDEDVLTMIHVLQQPELVTLLRHVPRPSLAAFQLLSRNSHLAWTGLLRMMDDSSTIKDVLLLSRLIRDTYNMGATRQALHKTQTREELQELHDRMIRRFNDTNSQKHLLMTMLRYEYPAPPRCGSSSIVPLTSWEELLQEGSCMHHCIGSYAEKIANNEIFIYKVTEPERLTLALKRYSSGWLLDELKGFQNAEPSPESRQAVRDWLQQPEAEIDQQTYPMNTHQNVARFDNTDRQEQVSTFIIARGQCSISAIQRRFRMSYSEACWFARRFSEQH